MNRQQGETCWEGATLRPYTTQDQRRLSEASAAKTCIFLLEGARGWGKMATYLQMVQAKQLGW